MKTLDQTLTAGQAVTLPCNGTFFFLMEAAAPLSVHFVMQGKGAVGEQCDGIRSGFQYEAPGVISKIIVTSETDQVIKWGYSFGRASYSTTTISQLQATTTENLEPVSLGVTATLILTGDATRRRLILTNPTTNTGAIALGGPSLTAANAARWLEPGDSYIETDAAPAAVYGLADVAEEEINIEVA